MDAISPSEAAIEKPVSQKELAQRFGLNTRSVEALRKQNKIPFIQAGGRILYQPSRVIKALEVDPQNCPI